MGAKSETSEELNNFLEHFGVKGMKWGVTRQKAAVEKAKERSKNPDRLGNRNNDKAQKRINRVRRVASGKASKTDKLVASLLKVPIQDLAVAKGNLREASQITLERQKKTQNKIISGKKRTTDILYRFSGNDIRELNFSYID